MPLKLAKRSAFKRMVAILRASLRTLGGIVQPSKVLAEKSLRSLIPSFPRRSFLTYHVNTKSLDFSKPSWSKWRI